MKLHEEGEREMSLNTGKTKKELEELEDDEQPPNTGTIAAISMAHIIFLNFFISKFPFPIKIYLLYLVFHLYKFAQKKLRVAKI